MSAKLTVAIAFIAIALGLLAGLFVLSCNWEFVTEEGKTMIPILFPLFSLVFGGVGIFSLRSVLRERKQQKDLLENGVPVEATVLGLELDFHTSVNGRHPSVVVCQAILADRELTFRSKGSFNYARVRKGDKVTVYIDPQNPELYHVEV